VFERDFPGLYEYLSQKDRSKPWDYNFKVHYFNAFEVKRKHKDGRVEDKVGIELANYRGESL